MLTVVSGVPGLPGDSAPAWLRSPGKALRKRHGAGWPGAEHNGNLAAASAA